MEKGESPLERVASPPEGAPSKTNEARPKHLPKLSVSLLILAVLLSTDIDKIFMQIYKFSLSKTASSHSGDDGCSPKSLSQNECDVAV
jgi:hypothetical protein